MIPFILSLIAGGQPAESPMLAAAKLRQERFKNVRVECLVKETVSAGGMSKGKDGKLNPAEETKMESTTRIAFAGSRIRYEHTIFVWVPNVRFREFKEIVVRAGAGTTTFRPHGLNGGPPTAVIMEGTVPIQDSVMLPLMQLVRGNDPALCLLPLDGLKPAKRTLAIDGVECEEFLGDGNASYWVDRNAAFAIRRIEFDRPSGRTEFNIRHVPGGQAIESWTMTERQPKGELRRKWEVEIKEWTVSESIPDDEFRTPFPPETEVHDTRDGTTFRVGENGAMVGADTPVAEPEPVPRRRWPLQIGAIAAIALLIALVVRSVRRRSA